MIVLDTSALIGWSESSDAHHAAAIEQLTAHVDDEFLASPITLAEFYVLPAKRGKLDHAVRLVADLGVSTVPLPADAPVRLAELRAVTGLKLPDCCVLLAALQSDAAVLTFDHRLRDGARAAGVRIA